MFFLLWTKKSLLIYLIDISSFVFIYGILALSQFGSSTELYESLINKIEVLEGNGDSYINRRRMQYDCYNNPYGYGCKNIKKKVWK